MIEFVSRKYRFGDMIFAYSGPAFQESDLVKRFRAETEAQVTETVVVTVIPDEELRKKNCAEMVLFETDKTPFYLVSDENNLRKVLLTERLTENFSWNVVLSLFQVPKYAILRGGAFLHSSMIDFAGQAVLFTAEKQVGKSTQAALWKKHRGVQTVNGDRALLYPSGGLWMAASTLYCGTSKIAENRALPLKAVVILSRAGREGSPEGKATVRKATPLECVRAIFDGCTFRSAEKEDIERMFALTEGLTSAVPFYKLYGTLGEDSVAVLEEQLSPAAPGKTGERYEDTV